MKKKFLVLSAVCIALCLLSSCAATQHVNTCVIGSPSGFWGGLWDGMIAPFAFIGHLFNSNIAVYDVNNNGGWYDFGFLLGIGEFSSGSRPKSHLVLVTRDKITC
ncbi:MAG: Phi17:2 [Patescibacteria group bacterium]|nr:Phi17:2 [Patescibacteria group bacterium]